MTSARHLASQDDVHALDLAGTRFTSLSIAEHSVDIVLNFVDGRTAVVRIESAGVLGGKISDFKYLEAGPELGRVLMDFIGSTVIEQNADSLDLVLVFDGGQSLRISVDDSGFESYEVCIEGEVYVAP